MIAALRAFFSRQAPALRSACATVLACEIALLIAMALHLADPAWALISVLVLATPTAGSSVQKAMLRVIGTLTGAALALLLIAWFDQFPVPFTMALAALCVVAAYGATGTRHPYAYLIGFVTVLIIAMEGLDTPDQAVDIAFARVCEVGIGVATAVLVRLSVWPVRGSERLRAELASTLEQGATLLGERGPAERDAAALAVIRSPQQHLVFLQAAAGESDLTRAQHRRHERAVAGVGAISDAVLASEAIVRAAPVALLTGARAALAQAMRELAQALRNELVGGGAAIASALASLRVSGGDATTEGAPSHAAALARSLSMLRRELGALAQLSDYLGPGGPEAPPAVDAAAGVRPVSAPRIRLDRVRLTHAVKVAIVVVAVLWLWMIFHLPGGMQGIVSAMMIAQRTLGASDVKGVQRLIGALIGGTAGILVASLLIPGVNDLAVFALLIAPALFAGAWLNDGSPRYGYIGFQSNFAFVLTLIAGSSPEPNTMAPVYRVCGVLIGVAVASIVLRALAPVDAWGASLRGLGRLVTASGTALSGSTPLGGDDQRRALRDRLAVLTAELRPGAARIGWPDWPLEELLVVASRLSVLPFLVDGHTSGVLDRAAEHISTGAQRLGAGLALRQAASGGGELAAADAQLERAGRAVPMGELADVGVLQTAVSVLTHLEQRLAAPASVHCPPQMNTDKHRTEKD